jgi:hypothetical protein
VIEGLKPTVQVKEAPYVLKLWRIREYVKIESLRAKQDPDC